VSHEAADLDLTRWIRAGDRVLWGQGSAEPLALIGRLIEQRAALSGVRVFLTISFSDLLRPVHGDHIRFEALGGLGRTAQLAKAGLTDVYPTHFGAFCRDLAAGRFAFDVFMVQLAGPDADGRYSLATDHGFALDAIRRARVVIAEVNAAAPFIAGTATVGAEDVDAMIRTARPLPEMPLAVPDAVDRAIAGHVLPFVEDGTTIELGVGAVPSAILEGLAGHRDLGIHTGMMTDAVIDLMERGAVTNARKPIDTGVTVATALFGSQRLYRAAPGLPIRLVPSSYALDVGTMARLDRFVAINSAIEADLTGQVNAEYAGGRYVGAPGGHVDFMRGARAAARGRSIVAMRARAAGGQPRIVAALAGAPVTCARTDVDTVVTEYGAAELIGKTLSQRIGAMIAIAHPDDREALAREARAIAGQGRRG
jgi:acetyl-CoA hydrolase